MGGSKKYEGNANMTTAHSRLAKEMGMRMEHFDIVLEHIGGALRDLDVSEVQIFPTMAIPSLHFHPQMSKGPLLEGFTSGTPGSLMTPALDVIFNCEIKVEDS